MRNYTEQLKSVWKSKDLTFIATFSKYKESEGFFNDFINPVGKKKLFYPNLDDIKVDQRKVSFYHPNAIKFIDGHFYKIELEHTDNPKGKSNPYSLEIKNVSALNQTEIKNFLEKKAEIIYSGVKYFGLYHKTNDTFASFDNVMFNETGHILMHQGETQKVFVSPNIDLKEGIYYSFSIKENEGKLPNALPETIEEIRLNPYQEFIRLRFERLNNPEANKMIANLMREIGKGMYSSKQRMIFELLQNADDAPGKEKVEFHIDINGDYFFVMHDGAPFNKDDIEAITSAAESTKRGDNKKTGYKGIGFKSVFTDSTEVWLKSGGYQFAFLRNSPLFEDFDNFYFSSARYTKYPELLEEDKKKYRNQRLRFNGSTDIPWQVIPIWHNTLPSEFHDSNFNNFNNPVQFALKLGENNIEDYKAAIDNITKRPQFLLFLRNTSKFRSPKNGVTVSRNDVEQVIEIIKSKKGRTNQIHHYTKQTFENIEVSDEAFNQLNIGLKKQSKINDYDEVTYFFTDIEGREIETIPPKLASATETEISFGISLKENKVSPEQDYLKRLSKYSSLFTYLPMEDTRFQLPFLVNADFVPSSNRQKIQGDNLWNKYIMLKVAEKHVETLSHYAKEFVKDNSVNGSYLSLLLMNILPKDESAQQIIESYNEKYIDQLDIEPIVVNDKNHTQLLTETILDDSGLIELFGHDMFYEIIATNKRLPHSNLDISYLKDYEYLEVEIISLKELAKHITPELCEGLGEIIANNSLYEKPELLNWLNKLAKYLPTLFGKIPFIVHNDTLFSLEQLVDENDAWLIIKNTFEYEELIKEIGYHTINLNLDEYQNINSYLLLELNGYVNDKDLSYGRIAANPNLPGLSIETKLNLIDFLQNSDFMVGIGETKYFGELELFNDENEVARPLWDLISRHEETKVTSLQKFSILQSEFNLLTDSLKKELITKSKIFISFILNIELFKEWSQQFNSENISNYVDDLQTIYSLAENTDDISFADWSLIPWLYIDNETRFLDAAKAYWSTAFHKLSTEDYLTIKSILKQTEIEPLPTQECGKIIQSFNLKPDDNINIDWTKINNLETTPANTLLDWMENDGNLGDFFEEYTIKPNENGLWDIVEIEDTQIFDSSNKELTTYINSIEELKYLFTQLTPSLCSENRDKIGLLQGDKLINAIIASEAFDQNLASFLPSKISWELLEYFILNLPELNLKTGDNYNSNSPEHIIIQNLLKSVENINEIPAEIKRTLKTLREKINVNQNPLSNYNISDRVSFGTKEDRKVLKLSDILEAYQGDSDELENVKESFSSITQKEKLRKLIFKTRELDHIEIHSKIEDEESTYYSVHQIVFSLLYKHHYDDIKWTKKHFDDYWLEQENKDQLKASYKLFLDILYEINFTDLNGFEFVDLKLENCTDRNYAVQSEIIPQWLEEWINIDHNKRVAFISKLGYNDKESPIVNLRKAAISDEYDQNTVIRYFEESKKNPEIIWNTILWLSKYSSKKITKNINIISQINGYIKLTDVNISSIIVPIISSINKEGRRKYILQAINLNSLLFDLGAVEEIDLEIFKALNKEDDNSLFIDSSIGNLKVHFQIEKVEYEEKVDTKILERDSQLWEESFYKEWEYYSEYPIYIYNGNEIPHIRTFKETTINEFTSNAQVEDDGNYYVARVHIKDVLEHLPESFPSETLQNLKDWHYKTLHSIATENERLKEELSLLKDKIQNGSGAELGSAENNSISKNDQIETNREAKEIVKERLEREGYKFTNNISKYSTIDGVMKEGEEFPLVVKSYKSKEQPFKIGANEWIQLMKPNSMLWVHFGNRELGCIKLFDLLKKHDNLTVSFSTDNLDYENRLHQFAELLHYFKGVHFNFDSLKQINYSVAAELNDYRFDANKIEEDLSSDSDNIL